MTELDSANRKRPITASIRKRIERSGERLWRLDDFRELPFTAVAQALSRLTRDGVIERLSKGVYYRNRQTVLGKSRPNPAAIQKLASPKRRSSRLESLPPISWVLRHRRQKGRNLQRAASVFRGNSSAAML